jgi:hypothetical protein
MKKSAPAPHIRSLVARLFGEKNFAGWNPGCYHDTRHAMYVAEVVAEMARSRRQQPEGRCFLAQVALLHDADPRPAGTAASVFRTLEWMWVHQETLQDCLGWTDQAFATALALIARTEYPFDITPRQQNTMFDGHSPYTLYRDLLSQLPAERRDQVFEDAQMLRFADQCANYCRDFATASASVDGLSQELSQGGRAVSRWQLDTPAFLDALASDTMWDARLHHQLRLQARLWSRSELLGLLTPAMRKNLELNKELFLRERGLQQAVAG